MTDEPLDALLARLEQERAEADLRYNEALTAVDRALTPAWHAPAPPPYDETQLAAINATWDLPPVGGEGSGLKDRVRRLIARAVAPSFDAQRRFNAAVVDHLNRNVSVHRDAHHALIAAIGHINTIVNFQAHLSHYFQSFTLYVDTRDRASAGQAQIVNAALSALTGDWLKRWESLSLRDARSDARQTALTKAYDDLREVVAIAQQSTLSVKRELERWIVSRASMPVASDATASAPVAAPTMGDLNSYVYVGFEDRFRGSRDAIRARLEDYLPLFAGATNVLDIGCGRGELLDLFREHGVAARGIDVNDEMVEVCRERGLVAERADAVGFLSAQPDDSLGGIIAIQVVEHLDPNYLMRLIDTARHKLRPGAPMVLETINAACWAAFFDSYIRDLTHVRPLHPDTLRYLVQAYGFSTVDVQFRAAVPDADRLQRVLLPPAPAGAEPDAVLVDLVDAVNSHADKLNARLFTHMDYAVVARR